MQALEITIEASWLEEPRLVNYVWYSLHCTLHNEPVARSTRLSLLFCPLILHGLFSLLSFFSAVPGAKSARKKEAWQVKAAQELSHTLLVVVITFAICWAPNQIFFFVYNMGAKLPFNTPVYHITVIMSLCNSCINPFIYFFKNKHYRVGLMKALSPICCSNKLKKRWSTVRTGPPPTNSTGTPSNSVNSLANVSRNNSFQANSAV